MLEINFKILKEINDNEFITQRKLASLTGVSLGKINSLLKEFIENGFIEKHLVDKRVRYEITKLGEDLLVDWIELAMETKLNINDSTIKKNVKQAVILGAGKQKDFNIPTGVLPIGDNLIIERTISILKEFGIEKILIITGFKSEEYNNAISKYDNVSCVYNPNYINTGTMSSLACAKGIISDDFILVESDLVFEKRAIKFLTDNIIRDCALITDVSGIGDETFVEIRNNYLYKIGKDMHQFNKIDGEFVGITKLSFKLFNLMLDEFSKNINPMVNYEYILLDVARTYDVGYVKVDALKWGEVDTLEQYNKIKNNIFPNINKNDNL
ncbi:winged helix-turn-helix transcriptional regulator [Clostridium sp. MB05]|uniref:winged helix-turn-helix transcriptional regulator n=1 Tax=Clostridium sp. MB05 TaxID=3376682 RepID=UPI0039823FE5